MSIKPECRVYSSKYFPIVFSKGKKPDGPKIAIVSSNQFYSYETDVGKFETKNRNDPGGKCSYKRQNNRFSNYCCGSFNNSYNLYNLVYNQNNTLDMRRRKPVMRISGNTIYLVASIIVLLAVVLLGEMKII